MSEICKWLHEKLEHLPIVKSPFNLQNLPDNGIYFFYEKDENSNHDDSQSGGSDAGGSDYNFKPRIVRIGTHREGNFRSRLAEHFLLNDSKMNFTIANSK